MSSAGELIRKIITDFHQGDNQEYDLFAASLLSPETKPKTLKNYLKGLKSSVSVLNRSNEALVNILMKLDWLKKGDSVIRAYQEFIFNLMSANAYYVNSCLNMLVKHFIIEASDVVVEDGKYIVDEETKKQHEENSKHIHEALQETCKIIPLAPVLLMPILEKKFPFHMTDVYVQEFYVTNLIQITHYIPSHRQQILELIVSKVTKLDVLSPRNKLDGREDSDDEELFEMENEDESKENKSNTEEMKHKDANSLDVLMVKLFDYIHGICYPNGDFDLEPAKKLYWDLLAVFGKIILPTHESCHIQFIMFYLSSFKPVLADGLIDYLWKMVQNPNTPVIYRQASVSYLASLLARGVYINIHTVKITIDLMVAWLHKYLDNLTEERQHDHVLHGTFYAVSQAAFYTFCFRNKEIFESRKGYKWAEALNFQRIVTSRLNPLLYCLPIVVSTFSSCTRRYQLAFCDTIIERNNRCMIPVISSNMGDKFTLKLSSFFPFDPYLLIRSGKYIQPIYRVYQGEIPDDDNDSEDEDDFLENHSDMVITPSSSLSKHVVEDLMNYATSPGFKTNQTG